MKKIRCQPIVFHFLECNLLALNFDIQNHFQIDKSELIFVQMIHFFNNLNYSFFEHQLVSFLFK